MTLSNSKIIQSEKQHVFLPWWNPEIKSIPDDGKGYSLNSDILKKIKVVLFEGKKYDGQQLMVNVSSPTDTTEEMYIGKTLHQSCSTTARLVNYSYI